MSKKSRLLLGLACAASLVAFGRLLFLAAIGDGVGDFSAGLAAGLSAGLLVSCWYSRHSSSNAVSEPDGADRVKAS